MLSGQLHRDTIVLDDADAAGLAEMELGAARGQVGSCLMVTLGTGIGTALIREGRLIPNLEFGHLLIEGREAEAWASGSAKARESICWAQYAVRLNRVLGTFEDLLWPELFVLGGGISTDVDQFQHLLDLRAQVKPARFRAEAGIVGAALAAQASHAGLDAAPAQPRNVGTSYALMRLRRTRPAGNGWAPTTPGVAR